MADFTTPQLIITTAGMAAATVAKPTGPFIEIVSFKIGSAFGYMPTPSDTDINGELLFQGAPLTYKYVGDNTLDIVCRLPADSGPFQFGEVALFLPGDVMFAKAAFADLQIKYSSLGTNVLSTYTFNCLLKLAQAVAVFKISTVCKPPDIWEVDFWSDVYPPMLSANPDIPSILVHELDANGNASLITRASDTQWSMAGNYKMVLQATVIGSSTTYVDFAQAEVVNVNPTTLSHEYVLATDDGYMRACSAVAYSGPNIRFTFTEPLVDAPPVGSKVIVNSMQTNQTLVKLTGGATGSAIIKGKQVNLEVSIDRGALLARSATWDAAGTYTFVVPEGVTFLYLDSVGGGAGGGGAGGGWALQDFPYVPDADAYVYRGGGGGGGGGAGESVIGVTLTVVPGETLTVIIGDRGTGGAGGAPGNNGSAGTPGGDTSISGSFGISIAFGGSEGGGGAGFGAPSGQTGAGGIPGSPGGFFGIDGRVGCAGGNGGTSPHGGGGAGGRGATENDITHSGADGGDAAGRGAGGGGGGAVYHATSTDKGGDGGDGTVGFLNITW